MGREMSKGRFDTPYRAVSTTPAPRPLHTSWTFIGMSASLS